MAMIGVGLILFGLAAIVLLPMAGAGALTKGPTSNEVSAIPAATDYPAPDLRLNDLDGNPVSLADQLGKWVLVNNWATWCPPCKAEMPTLQAYDDAHREQNFILIAIEEGEPVAQVAEYVEKNNLHITVWPDPEQKVYDLFHNISLPASWLIDPQGQVRLAWVGAISREMLEKHVTPLLEE
jgi:cytochrome c biogenesis protein CcmG, thiol:disulfide interchange protein DsbE